MMDDDGLDDDGFEIQERDSWETIDFTDKISG